jgi:hypothetical protein
LGEKKEWNRKFSAMKRFWGKRKKKTEIPEAMNTFRGEMFFRKN